MKQQKLTMFGSRQSFGPWTKSYVGRRPWLTIFVNSTTVLPQAIARNCMWLLCKRKCSSERRASAAGSDGRDCMQITSKKIYNQNGIEVQIKNIFHVCPCHTVYPLLHEGKILAVCSKLSGVLEVEMQNGANKHKSPRSCMWISTRYIDYHCNYF